MPRLLQQPGYPRRHGPAPGRSPAHRRANHPSPHGAGHRPLAADDRRAGPAGRAWSTAAATIRCGSAITSPSRIAIFDPLLQLAQAAVVSRRLLFGTGVYLLPLRHPTPVAKQVSTLDHLTEGRFIFGVGVGGEFPKEYEACGVPLGERGARLERKPRRAAQAVERRAREPRRPLLQVRRRPDAAAAAPGRRAADLVRRPLRRRRCGASAA